MNIKVSKAYPSEYYAVDDDTYDGPGSTIGSGSTPAAAINDLVAQLCCAFEERIDALEASLNALETPPEKLVWNDQRGSAA